MLRSLLAASLLLLLALGTSAQAQKLAVWKCPMPTGTYEVALRYVTSVSVHQYYLTEGGIQITELVIDTTGNTEARFYCMEPATQSAGGLASTPAELAQARAQTLADHASSIAGGTTVSDLQNSSVVKSYPATTHSHTVEYRVGSPGDIDSLFKSVEAAWTSNTSTSYDATGAAGKTTTAPGN